MFAFHQVELGGGSTPITIFATGTKEMMFEVNCETDMHQGVIQQVLKFCESVRNMYAMTSLCMVEQQMNIKGDSKRLWRGSKKEAYR